MTRHDMLAISCSKSRFIARQFRTSALLVSVFRESSASSVFESPMQSDADLRPEASASEVKV